MPYCSEVSHARNVRRQHAFWDEVEGEERNLWGFISTAYMSLRLHNPALEAGLVSRAPSSRALRALTLSRKVHLACC